MIYSDFIKLYEKLNAINEVTLTEAKADTQKLITFAGKDLADRFLKIKHRLKTPENDLYYWIKNKSVKDLEQTVSEVENTDSNFRSRKTARTSGAQLVAETEHWKIYYITTYEASQLYGRDTKWCITGINNYGDRYWKEYSGKGIKFYFLITKGQYNPRGTDSKFALAVDTSEAIYVFNQIDEQVSLSSIPYFKELYKLPLDLNNVALPPEPDNTECTCCGGIISTIDPDPLRGEPWITINSEALCSYCLIDFWNEYEKLIDLFIAISMINTSAIDLLPLINEAKLNQEKIDRVIKDWVQAKKDGTLASLNFSKYEITDTETKFIKQATELGFKVSQADLI